MKLGEFELLLLNRLRELGPITPARLLEQLQDSWPASYSTLAITLRRLEKKGLIRGRALKGRSREYWVEADSPAYRDQASQLSQQLVKAFGASSLLSLNEGIADLPTVEIDKLIDELERLKTQRKASGGG